MTANDAKGLSKPEQFISVIAPISVRLRQEGSSIFPSVRIAQAGLETGWTIHPWNNVVGLKAGGGKPNEFWDGRTVNTKTWEVYDGTRYDNVSANWRAYDSVENCFRDQDLLFQLSRYDQVRAAQTPQDQTRALYLGGYATDPAYASKLDHLIRAYSLNVFDKLREVEALQLEHDWQWKMLGDSLQGLHTKGIITEHSWVEKVYNKQLSVSELAWLNMIILARQSGIDI